MPVAHEKNPPMTDQWTFRLSLSPVRNGNDIWNLIARSVVIALSKEDVFVLAPLDELAPHQIRLRVPFAIPLTKVQPLFDCFLDGFAFGHYFSFGKIPQPLLQRVLIGLRLRPASGAQRPLVL